MLDRELLPSVDRPSRRVVAVELLLDASSDAVAVDLHDENMDAVDASREVQP